MAGPITADELGLLRLFLEKECGLSLTAVKPYLVESRLLPLIAKEGVESYGELYLRLTDPRQVELRDKVIEAMTTHETLWFRDRAPFEALRRLILPGLRAKPRVRIWSAACSTGQEPYSIAMSAIEARRERTLGAPVEVVATDISGAALRLAQAGRYDRLSMSRGLDPASRQRYFAEEGQAAAVLPEVRQLVRFERFNLLHEPARLGRFDVVFCRNVAIYFSDRCKAQLLERIAAALEPGGFLFLGGGEVYPTLLVEPVWVRTEGEGAVYYRRQESPLPRAPR